MTEGSAASQALAVARAQRDALARGDIEVFLDGMRRQQQTCAALVEAGISNAEEALVVDELAGAIRESQALLDSLMAEATTRLGHLRVTKSAAGAYLKTSPRPALRTREA